MHEYMAKNFEAMAAGCVLLTLPTSEEEAAILGFVDMETVVFYRDLDELCGKLDRLRKDPELTQRIADQGRHLAESRHQDAHRGEEMKQLLLKPLGTPPPFDFGDRWNLFKLRCYHALNGE
jgi:spore maturation protein CgeB